MFVYGKRKTGEIEDDLNVEVPAHLIEDAVGVLASNHDRKNQFLEDADRKYGERVGAIVRAMVAMDNDLVIGLGETIFVNALGVQVGIAQSLHAAKSVFVANRP